MSISVLYFHLLRLLQIYRQLQPSNPLNQSPFNPT
jgi:hypothetical protein